MRFDIFTTPEGEPFLPSVVPHDLLLDDAACYWQDTTTNSSLPDTSASFSCIPQNRAYISGRFQDADCTQGMARRFISEGDCPRTAVYAYDRNTGMAAAIIGPAADEGGFGFDEQNVCVPLAPSEPPNGPGGSEYEYSLIAAERTMVAHAVDLVD